MKKSKLLIPALSIASVGVVVAPIVTSCKGDAFMTITNPAFVGTVHEKVEEANAWDVQKASNEYFKDKKYIVEDIATDTIVSVSDLIKAQYKERAENIKVETFMLKFNDLTLGQDRVTDKGFGYIVSGSYDCDIKYTFDVKPTTEEQEKGIEKTHYEDTLNVKSSFSNCFARIEYNTTINNWALYINGNATAFFNWNIKFALEGTTKCTVTYKDNVTKTTTGHGSEAIEYSIKNGNNVSIFVGNNRPYCASNYLSQVAYQK